MRVEIDKLFANAFGAPVAFVLISKSIRSILFKSIVAKMSQGSEINFHRIVIILNAFENQIYQKPLKLSAQEELNRRLRIVKSDKQADMLFVYLKFLPELQMYAFSFLNDLQESEDVTASVMEKFMLSQSVSNVDKSEFSESEWLGYLKVTIRNACIDALRHRKVKRSAIAFLGVSIQFWKRPEVYDKFQLEAFDMLLLELSPREREILELHLQGLKNDDISEQLGLSALTVRNTLHNAKKRVRKLWNIFMR